MALETEDGRVILIDTGPDLRTQVLRERIKRVDAVLYTHAHADHLNGIDDLRAFCQIGRNSIPIYANAETMENIRGRFGYALHNQARNWDLPSLTAHLADTAFESCGEHVIPIPINHGRAKILGWRIRDFAYLTDVSEIPPDSLALLEGLQVLLLDCLRYAPHHTHINVEQSVAYAGLIGARQTFLIHMTHEIEYGALESTLPEGVHVGFDGLRLALA